MLNFFVSNQLKSSEIEEKSVFTLTRKQYLKTHLWYLDLFFLPSFFVSFCFVFEEYKTDVQAEVRPLDAHCVLQVDFYSGWGSPLHFMKATKHLWN